MANFNLDVNVNPDRGLKTSSQPRDLIASYGDGYEQRVAAGINNVPEVWELTWKNRTSADSSKVSKFLEDHGGVTSFDWFPTEYNIASTTTGVSTKKLIDTSQYFSSRYLNTTVTVKGAEDTSVDRLVRALTGTLAAGATLTSAVGTGTSFQDELLVGDSISVSGVSRVISTIDSQTALTVTAAFDSAFSGLAVNRDATVLTGSITPINGVGVVGAGTAFTSEVLPGDSILINSVTKVVSSVVSDTGLVITVPYSDTTAIVTAVDSPTQLSLSADIIMSSGETYTIYPYKKYKCDKWSSEEVLSGFRTVSATFTKVFEP